MKQQIKLFIVWTLAMGAFGFSSLVWAQDAGVPVPEAPNLDVTMTIGKRMPQAEEALEGWQEELVRKLATYDAYSPEMTDARFVLNRLKYCTGSNGQPMQFCKYDEKDVGNDVLASTLLDTRAYEDDKQAEAAFQFIKNVTNPIPSAFPKDKDLFKDNGGLTDYGISFFASLYKKIPQLTLSQNSFLAIYADRARLKDFGKNLPVGDGDGRASMMEMMYYEVERRYMNDDWYNQMNQSSTDALLKEIANMMAYQSFVDLKRYEQMTRIEALMAAQAGTFGSIGGDFSEMMEEADKAEKEAGGGKKKSSGEKKDDASSAVGEAFGIGG